MLFLTWESRLQREGGGRCPFRIYTVVLKSMLSLKTKDVFFLKFHDFAPLLLTKLFCDVINREAGRVRKRHNFSAISFLDVDSDLTTLGNAEQDCANLRDKGFSDKKAFICKI